MLDPLSKSSDHIKSLENELTIIKERLNTTTLGDNRLNVKLYRSYLPDRKWTG